MTLGESLNLSEPLSVCNLEKIIVVAPRVVGRIQISQCANFPVQGVALSEGEFGVPHNSGDLRRLKWETSPKRAFPWGGISKNLRRTSFRLRKLVGSRK